MSTSTMRSEHGDTRSEGDVTDAPVATRSEGSVTDAPVIGGPGRVRSAWRRVRRFISTILFGSDAVTMLDMRDINAYLETTEG